MIPLDEPKVGDRQVEVKRAVRQSKPGLGRLVVAGLQVHRRLPVRTEAAERCGARSLVNYCRAATGPPQIGAEDGAQAGTGKIAQHTPEQLWLYRPDCTRMPGCELIVLSLR